MGWQLSLEYAAYSPEARGRSERAFATHQGRLPKELAWAGITDMTAANAYLRAVYQPAFNAEFAQPPLENGTAFVPFLGDILCEQFERTVGKDNCVRFESLTLQIPSDRHGVTTLKPKFGYIATRTVPWRCSTAHVSWQSTIVKDRSRKNCARLPRNSASRRLMGNCGRLSPTVVSHLNKKRTIHLLQNRTYLFVANRKCL
jgi:hypothetical protein